MSASGVANVIGPEESTGVVNGWGGGKGSFAPPPITKPEGVSVTVLDISLSFFVSFVYNSNSWLN